MKPWDIWDPDTKIAHSGTALCYSPTERSVPSPLISEGQETVKRKKRWHYIWRGADTKLTALEKTRFIQMAICRADSLQDNLWHEKKSCAQKTFCQGKIKSPEAVKSGIAVKITFTWEGRQGALQLLILFRDNACTTARSTEATITPANIHQNLNLKYYQRLKIALSFSCINYQGNMQSSVNGSCLLAQHWV